MGGSENLAGKAGDPMLIVSPVVGMFVLPC